MTAAAAAAAATSAGDEHHRPEQQQRRLMGRRAAVDFAMGGAAAVVAKTGAAPVERVKLLLQNQAEMLRRGSLTRPYAGIADAFARVLREEGVAALWRGNQANVIRYFPTQMLAYEIVGKLVDKYMHISESTWLEAMYRFYDEG